MHSRSPDGRREGARVHRSTSRAPARARSQHRTSRRRAADRIWTCWILGDAERARRFSSEALQMAERFGADRNIVYALTGVWRRELSRAALGGGPTGSSSGASSGSPRPAPAREWRQLSSTRIWALASRRWAIGRAQLARAWRVGADTRQRSWTSLTAIKGRSCASAAHDRRADEHLRRARSQIAETIELYRRAGHQGFLPLTAARARRPRPTARRRRRHGARPRRGAAPLRADGCHRLGRLREVDRSMSCPRCGHEAPAGSAFCDGCGAEARPHAARAAVRRRRPARASATAAARRSVRRQRTRRRTAPRATTPRSTSPTRSCSRSPRSKASASR